MRSTTCASGCSQREAQEQALDPLIVHTFSNATLDEPYSSQEHVRLLRASDPWKSKYVWGGVSGRSRRRAGELARAFRLPQHPSASSIMPTAVILGAGTVGLAVLKKYVRLLGRLPTVVVSSALDASASGADQLEPIAAAWRKGLMLSALSGPEMVSTELSGCVSCARLT